MTPLEIEQLRSTNNLFGLAVGVAGMLGLVKMVEEMDALSDIAENSQDDAEVRVAQLNLAMIETTVSMLGTLENVAQA